MLKSKSVTLTIILSIFWSISTFSQDMLDNVKKNSGLIHELKDIYRAFHVNNIIIEQKELINIYQDDDTTLNESLGEFIKKCDSLRQIHFYNDTLNSFVSKYLRLTAESYKIALDKGFNSPDFKTNFEKYKAAEGEYMNYLYSRYATNHFVSMNEDKYWQINNKNNYIKSGKWSQYKELDSTDLKASLILLDSITKQANDFQEYSIYQIEFADEYEKHKDSLGDNASEIAVKKYKTILDQKKYSIYLFEAWLKWRAVTQEDFYGISKTSDIPNDYYDRLREQVALTILKYIEKNEKDEMAINEFLLMATHDIVKRFGKYPYGNQNTIEYHEIFDGK